MGAVRKHARQASVLVITNRCAGTGDSRLNANMAREVNVVWSTVVEKSRSLRDIAFVIISRCVDMDD